MVLWFAPSEDKDQKDYLHDDDENKGDDGNLHDYQD
jgi:hypothetical protein